jgi:alcohol dehydrogenase
MKALVYHGPGRRSWIDVPDPQILQPDDAIVRVDAVTICGTDLHILNGDVPEVESGRILGHEAVGTIQAVGAGVRNRAVGDRVLVSCITSCGRCAYCREGVYGQCTGGGGWILGHTIDGTQAQYVRVPFADTSTHHLPDGISDTAAVLLADIVPTAYEVGVLNGHVRPGDVVVVVGAGPVGLATVVTARLFSPAHVVVVDGLTNRQDAAKMLGADMVLSPRDDVAAVVRDLTHGAGADVSVEAVGTPETFEACIDLVRPGGHVANVGVHGRPAMLHVERIWSRNLTITTGLVDTAQTPRLLDMVVAGQLQLDALVTHRFGIDEMMDAYDVFTRAAESNALKVVAYRT